MSTKTFLKNISPFNNKTEMPKALYIVKKFLAFLFVYAISALVGEAIVIGTLYIMGYDPLNGVMPQGAIAGLIPYYGFIGFFTVTLLYCRIIEKRRAKTLGFTKCGFDYLLGGIIAVALLFVIITVCCVTGALDFVGLCDSLNIGYLVALFFGFAIQGLAEEVMCRGFLMQSLLKKTSLSIAIFVSSTAFALPHLPTLFDADFEYAIVGIVNLYLVSAIFSILCVLRGNIVVVGAMHSIWNFVLYGALGLSVSGSDSISNGILNFNVTSQNLLNGGIYGIEASVITTVVLGMILVALAKRLSGRRVRNGF